jgi:NADH-quinone oxidoreductase subunit N
MNVGIFAVITVISGYDEALPMIEDYRGLLYRSPVLGGVLIFFLVSLVGVPFTGGFFGKFYSFSAAVGGGAVWLAIIGLLNSGLAAAYYLRLALVSAQRPREGEAAAPEPRVGIAVMAALAMAVAATLILGIVPNAVLRAAEAGAHTLQAPAAPTELNGVIELFSTGAKH